MNRYQNTPSDEHELSLILNAEPEQTGGELTAKRRHSFIGRLYGAVLKKSGVKLSRDELVAFFDSYEGREYFQRYEHEPEDMSNLIKAVNALHLSLTPERQEEISTALKASGILPVPSTPPAPSCEETQEAPLSETVGRVLEFLHAHSYQNYTAHQIALEIDTDDREVWNAMKKLLARKKPLVMKDSFLRGTVLTTRYKYCPEWYDLHSPGSNRLNAMCRAIRVVLTEHPGTNRRKLQTLLKAYLLRVDNRLRDDAIHLMARTEAIVAEPGKRGAKLYTYNDDWKTGKKARLYNQIVQSEQFTRYREPSC